MIPVEQLLLSEHLIFFPTINSAWKQDNAHCLLQPPQCTKATIRRTLSMFSAVRFFKSGDVVVCFAKCDVVYNYMITFCFFCDLVHGMHWHYQKQQLLSVSFHPCYLVKAHDMFIECCLNLTYMREIVILWWCILVITVIQKYVANCAKKAMQDDIM